MKTMAIKQKQYNHMINCVGLMHYKLFCKETFMLRSGYLHFLLLTSKERITRGDGSAV